MHGKDESEGENPWRWGDALGSLFGDVAGLAQTANQVVGAPWAANTMDFMAGTGDLWGKPGGLMADVADTATGGLGGAGAAPFIGGGLDIFTGISKIMDGNTGGGVGDIISGGAGILSSNSLLGNAGGLMPGAAGQMGQTWGGGILTGVGGAAQMLGNMAEMEKHKDERRGDYWSNDYWGSAGDATLGALHAGVGSWCPVADMYITGFELAGDAIGGGAGLLGEGVEWVDSWFGDDEVEDRDWKFGAGDVLGWGLHGAHDLVDAIPGGHYVTDGIAGGVEAVGGAVSDAASAVWSFLSDARLKTDVAPITGALDLL